MFTGLHDIVCIVQKWEIEFSNSWDKMLFWIGMTDQNGEGTWELASSGTHATYFNWASGWPNNYWGSRHCALLRAGGCTSWDHTKWADLDCNQSVVRITCAENGSFSRREYSINALSEFEKMQVRYGKVLLIWWNHSLFNRSGHSAISQQNWAS